MTDEGIAHDQWDDLVREWMKQPAYRRFSDRVDRFPADFWRGADAGMTTRAVTVATRKYRARRKRRK
jgi:hypothetical protein